MNIGGYEISIINHGTLKLDGGATFGSVPKNLWSKLITADEQNRILLATNSLLLTGHGKVILVDLGMGNKWNAKQREIFAITPNLDLKLPEITDIILTHLHFDHAGGISKIINDKLELCFPKAKIWLQRANFMHAQAPSIKECASYIAENISPLNQADLSLIDGDSEILENIIVHSINGHTTGQQWIEIKDKSRPLFFPSDLIPTAHHVHIAYHLGYDLCAKTAIEEKASLLTRAIQERALVVYQHDSKTSYSSIEKLGLDNFKVADII